MGNSAVSWTGHSGCTYDLKAAMILCTRSNMSTFHHEQGGAHEELMATGAGRVIFLSGVGNSKLPETAPPSPIHAGGADEMQRATRKDGKVGDDLLRKLRGSAAVVGR